MTSSCALQRALVCLFFLLTMVPPPASATTKKSEELARHLMSQDPKGKAAVLAALPTELKENFVLVKRSRSRQRGTAELPRILHFTKNADLVVSSSGHDYSADRAGNDLEIMEFDEQTGEWTFSTIPFDEKGVLGIQKNVAMCKNCHGDRPRPIWGDYPNWPTAFGGSTTGKEEMEGQELTDYSAFKAIQPNHEGYRHLLGSFSNDHFSLANSVYDKPNTTFTARLGVLTAQANYLHAVSAGQDWKRNGAAFAAAALSCAVPKSLNQRIERDYDERIKADSVFADRWSPSARPTKMISFATRLLGLDPTVDFELATFPAIAEKNVDLDMQAPWNSSSDYLHALVAFKFFYFVYRQDPQLKKDLAARATEIEAIENDSFTVSKARLVELDRPATAKAYQDSLFPYLHTRVWPDEATKKLACEGLLRQALRP